jgi:hypothetical protein
VCVAISKARALQHGAIAERTEVFSGFVKIGGAENNGALNDKELDAQSSSTEEISRVFRRLQYSPKEVRFLVHAIEAVRSKGLDIKAGSPRALCNRRP